MAGDVDLFSICRAALADCAVQCRSGVECVLDLGAGQASLPTDPKQLRRVLGRAVHSSTHLNLSSVSA